MSNETTEKLINHFVDALGVLTEWELELNIYHEGYKTPIDRMKHLKNVINERQHSETTERLSAEADCWKIIAQKDDLIEALEIRLSRFENAREGISTKSLINRLDKHLMDYEKLERSYYKLIGSVVLDYRAFKMLAETLFLWGSHADKKIRLEGLINLIEKRIDDMEAKKGNDWHQPQSFKSWLISRTNKEF